jgi:8-oxo-dGTP diphosphatase
LRLLQMREPGMERGAFEQLVAQVLTLARSVGARVLVSSDIALARSLGADGVHLPARQLLQLKARPDLPLVAASCHDAVELRAAETLGADFAVLGPVKPTPTHPDASTLGWNGFEQTARNAAVPVYALGGINPDEMKTAWSHGAHGIAMLRGAWEA